MPPKNRVKTYGENVFYHAYNRGFNQQTIFHDDQDYRTFLYLFKRYLELGFKEKRFTPKGEEYFVEPNHVYNEVDLLAYCLMPNHFHLLLYQKSLKGMPKLLVRLCANYAVYYNRKYNRQGSPFQGTYRAVIVRTEEQFFHLSRYIHINPVEITKTKSLDSYPYSSYRYYAGEKAPPWLKTETILGKPSQPTKYKNFVEDYLKLKPEDKAKELDNITKFLIE